MWIIKLLFCILLLRDASCKKRVKTTTYLPNTSIIIANSTESVSTMSATTDEPTTSAETTTAAPEKSPCQGGQSMIMERDIQVMINYYLEQSHYHQILDDGHNRLQQLVNNTADQIEEYVQWFHEQPEHLKHVLKVLADFRHSAEPYMQAIAYQFQYLPYVQKSYENNQDEFNKLVDKYKKLNEICQWKCQNDWQSHGHQNEHVYDHDGYDRQDLYGYHSEHQYATDYELRQRSETIESNQSYYCTTLKDLNNKINDRVRNFKSSMENKIHAELALTSEELNATLKKFKDELEDNALNKFGRPMYEILTLEDSIIHFNEIVGSVNVESIIGEIQNVILGVKNNLMELQRGIDSGRECSGCPYHQLLKLVSNGATYNMPADSKENGDMIDLLFDVIAKEIEDQFSQKVKQTVENLKGKMNERFEVLHEYTYKAIQDHLKQLTIEESEYFQDISSTLQSFDKIQSLVQNYNSLYEEIEHYVLTLQ